MNDKNEINVNTTIDDEAVFFLDDDIKDWVRDECPGLDFIKYKLLQFRKGDNFDVHIPTRTVDKIYELAYKYGRTMSSIIREVLYNPLQLDIPPKLKRPAKFTEPVHKFKLSLHEDDKPLWKIRMMMFGSEFGSYVRYLLELYEDHLEEIAASATLVYTTRKLKTRIIASERGTRCGYQFLVSYDGREAHSAPTALSRITMLFGRKKRRFYAKQLPKLIPWWKT